jgi:hypothetical protein
MDKINNKGLLRSLHLWGGGFFNFKVKKIKTKSVVTLGAP